MDKFVNKIICADILLQYVYGSPSNYIKLERPDFGLISAVCLGKISNRGGNLFKRISAQAFFSEWIALARLEIGPYFCTVAESYRPPLFIGTAAFWCTAHLGTPANRTYKEEKNMQSLENKYLSVFRFHNNNL